MCIRDRCTFVVVARDQWGHQVGRGGERFVLAFRGPSNPRYSMHDHGGGVYGFAYASAVSGHYVMSVTLGGVHVPGSPFTVTLGDPGAAADRPPSPRLALGRSSSHVGLFTRPPSSGRGSPGSSWAERDNGPRDARLPTADGYAPVLVVRRR